MLTEFFFFGEPSMSIVKSSQVNTLQLIGRLTHYHRGHLCLMDYQGCPLKYFVYSVQWRCGLVFSRARVILDMMPTWIQGSETGPKQHKILNKLKVVYKLLRKP